MKADDLRRLAVERAKQGDFGPEASALNEALVALVPRDEAGWTRLARCRVVGKDFQGALHACDQALALNPSNTIARNLRSEARRAQSFASAGDPLPTSTGFPLSVFDVLGRCAAGGDALVASRFDALLEALNETTVAHKVVGLRGAHGRSGTRLYHRNRLHWQSGHVYSFHYGGRWEPQFNLGLFSAHQWPTNCLRAGIGFNLTRDGMDPDPAAGQARVLAYFAAFQRALRSRWRGHLVAWMNAHGGQFQRGAGGPQADWTAERQVEWLTTVTDPIGAGWIFVGRWWYAHQAADRVTLASLPAIRGEIESTFRDLLPLWTDVWHNAELP